MKLAWLMAARSTCRRLNVGCVITSADFRQVLAVGYNGNAAGLPNTCDSEEPGNCGCIHGEDNAVIKCASPPYEPKVVFCTHQPCKACAKRLVNLGGVKIVHFDEPYRLTEGLDVLAKAGIDTIRFQVNVEKGRAKSE